MLAAHRTFSSATQGALRSCTARHVNLAPPPTVARRLLVARASKDSKSWGEIAAEAVEVAKDVGSKLKDSITSLVPGKKQQQPDSSRLQQRSPYGRDDDRPLPMQLPGGGLLGGLVGGLLNTAVKGLAKELEKSAQQTRSVTDLAANRISSSRRIKQRLGEVTVGLPMSQSVASQSINGRVSKTVSLLLPVYNLAGAAVAQAQVTQVEGPAQNTCRIAVRMPEGDSVVLDDADEPGSSSSRRKAGAAVQGDVIDAEFRDLK
ncbi:hypothetical protein OEZ85_007091 [Tetradesmus obliquus]|uniref:Uncharacterized protein n=1 Tax=Tetradesmus obliquus TaxID=3088 RepID=A0ABY8U1G0_TETOB|nr:hypothetical protein OEZ85_007091 [Tetradesmus obliquus]